jgi:hypothetical protein
MRESGSARETGPANAESENKITMSRALKNILCKYSICTNPQRMRNPYSQSFHGRATPVKNYKKLANQRKKGNCVVQDGIKNA